MRLSYTGICFVEDENKRQKQKTNIYERTKLNAFFILFDQDKTKTDIKKSNFC